MITDIIPSAEPSRPSKARLTRVVTTAIAGVAEQPQVGGEAAVGERGRDPVGPARPLAEQRQQGEQFAGGRIAQRLRGELFPGQPTMA
jgi:hypothetical protein